MTCERINELKAALNYAICIIEELNDYSANMCKGFAEPDDNNVAARRIQIDYLKRKLEAK